MSTTFATWEILKVCILKLSPPLKGKLTFTWIQDHMEYEILAATVTLNMDTPQTPPGTIASTISDASTWQQFHQLIFPLLQEWPSMKVNTHIAYAWKIAFSQGLNLNISGQSIQEIM